MFYNEQSRPAFHVPCGLARRPRPSQTRLRVDLHHTPATYTAHPGWRTTPAPFDQHLLYYAVRGTFRARIGTREETLRPGDLLWIAPWTSFTSWLPGHQPATFRRFRLAIEDSAGRVLALHKGARIIHGLESAPGWIDQIVRQPEARPSPLRTWRLRGALLGLFADALAPSSRTASRGKLSTHHREALLTALDSPEAAHLTPAKLAARLRLTPDYFARLFRRTHQISPRAWIVRERIKRAAVRLLESQLSIGEIADEFGYRDIYFFSRQFKQVIGRSPSAYRRHA